MKLVKTILRPNKVEDVKNVLSALHVFGLTVTEVRGHGKQKGRTVMYRGHEYSVDVLTKMEVEVVVSDEMVDPVVAAIIAAARTGEVGDGRIFVVPVEESYRIRTGDLLRD